MLSNQFILSDNEIRQLSQKTEQVRSLVDSRRLSGQRTTEKNEKGICFMLNGCQEGYEEEVELKRLAEKRVRDEE